MHTIEPARLKPGVDADSLPDGARSPARRQSSNLISGRALIFWDPMSLPGTRFAKKLDAIDTDQITPAADCVSESLETLDEKWKAGSFRHLMPDFRAARASRRELRDCRGSLCHRLVARNEPGGTQGCRRGSRPRDWSSSAATTWATSFAATASTSACTSCRARRRLPTPSDGDAFTFDPAHAALTNETQGKVYEPVPLSPKEEEIRRSGGIFAVGRREFRESVRTRPSVDWPDERGRPADDHDRADRVGAPGRQGAEGRATDAWHDAPRLRRSAARVRRHGAVCDPHVQSDHRRRRRSTRDRRRLPTTTSCSPAWTADEKQTSIGREFAARARPREAVLRDAGRRHLPLLFSRAGPGDAGTVHPRRRFAQPRLRRLRRGRHRRGVDDARVRMVDGVHLLHAGEAAPRPVHRPSAAMGRRQGHRPRAAPALGRQTGAGHVGRARRRRSASCRWPTATRSRT